MKARSKILYNKIISLLDSNIVEATKEMSKLDSNAKEEFNLYLTNRVMHVESAKYRGRVIEMSVYLENVLARFLSYYFASENKREILNSMVFDRMDLQRKLNTLKSIIKTNHPKVWKREQSKLKRIDKLISFRNNLAHSVLNSTYEGKNKLMEKVKKLESTGSNMKQLDEIEYGYFDNHSWVVKIFNVDELNKYLSEIHESIDLIEEIGNELIENYDRLTVSKLS